MFIDWLAFVKVFVAALTGAVSIVLFYALGMRLLVRAGRVKHVGAGRPVEVLMHVTERDRRRAERRALRAAAAPPITDFQRRIALVLAYACLAVCVLAVAGGIFLIVGGH